MLDQNLPADVQDFLQQEVACGKFSNETEVVVAAVRQFRDSETVSDDIPDLQSLDTMNWDDLIPVPPERPSGRIQVRLKGMGRDRPSPAENPFAE